MPEDAEFDYAAFGKGLMDAIDKARHPKSEEPAKSEPDVQARGKEAQASAPAQNEGDVEVGKPYVKDGITYYPMRVESIGDVINTLNKNYHPDQHSAMKCTKCRPLIEKVLAGDDFDVSEDKTGKITWQPKKR